MSFLRGPEADEFSLARPPGADKKGGPAEELQRAVTIHLIVKPYERIDEEPFYPTEVSPSRWNCVLDLASSNVSDPRLSFSHLPPRTSYSGPRSTHDEEHRLADSRHRQQAAYVLGV